MKKKRTRLQTLWLVVAICIALVFVTTTLIPSLVPMILNQQIVFDANHFVNSDFWMGMSFLAVIFIAVFTMIYWYMKEHHMHE